MLFPTYKIMLLVQRFKLYYLEVFNKTRYVAINCQAIEEIDRGLEHDKEYECITASRARWSG